MKSLFLGALVCLFFGAGTLSILAQGPLTPPGAPTPTMKSLDQIEARRPISSVPFVINASGSYYLTKNLTSAGGSNAIIIQANNVTLDLNGFNLSSTENSGALGSYGIAINATSGVAILNGSITGSVTFSGGTFSGPGFGRAISCSAAAATNMRVVGVSVSGCYAGIDMGANSSVADSCTVDTVAARGITATAVTRCSSRNCGGEAIVGNNVSDSFGECGWLGLRNFCRHSQQLLWIGRGNR
jgi:hypothetical protein